MPNGVRSRGNSRHANRRRNSQRDTAVRAEMVAPEIVIQAEPISVQADPDITQQLQQRIAELEAQVKQVKRNYKSAKKQADDHDNIITNMTQYFKDMSEKIGMTRGDILSPTWLNRFTEKVNGIQGHYDSMKKSKDCLRESCDKWKSKYRMACEGTLMAFQETEIRDLQDENDKLMKLNKTLLKRAVDRKDEMESQVRINANMTEDFCKLLNKLGSNKISIQGIHISTAKLLESYMDKNPDEEMACCVGKGMGLVVKGKKLIDTDKKFLYMYNPETKYVYDNDDGELLGKLIKKNGKLKIQWIE